MTAPDRVDRLVSQWKAERPDLDLDTMALVARLLHVARLAGLRIDAFAGERGINRGEGDVLFTLRRAGPPYRLSPSQLADSLLVASGTMTNRLDRLEERELIRRIPHPDDRRSLEVELTPGGRRLVDEAVTAHLANEQQMLEPLSEREREQLGRITRKLLAHLEAGG